MQILRLFILFFALGFLLFLIASVASLKPLPTSLAGFGSDHHKAKILDREGQALSESYFDEWNRSERLHFYEFPERLRSFVIFSEDRKFFSHRGVDWKSRAAALWQNLRSLRVVRGASTIDEQVIRMIHPRKRNLWSKWIEGWEAWVLNQRFSKAEILQFYLNQVPFSRHRRGFVQAAELYFSRSLDDLSDKEWLSLVVLLRAPNRFDPYRHPERLEKRVLALTEQMLKHKLLSKSEAESIQRLRLRLHYDESRVWPVQHFVRHIRSQFFDRSKEGRIETTLDLALQNQVKRLIARSQDSLETHQVDHISALVLDHQSDEVLVWAQSGEFWSAHEGSQIDFILSPRQAGSTLKPFLYAQALQKSWRLGTLIDDSSLVRPISHGVHEFKNYSKRTYGELPLYEALANSLNIPAVHAIEYVGVSEFGLFLEALGYELLKKPEDYDLSLALGASEVSLLEQVEAYACLARNGLCRASRFLKDEMQQSARQVLDPQIAQKISAVLSDPLFRSKEFGAWSVLRFPSEVAIKTGTSSAYRDAWAIAYNKRFVVGVWMGNHDRRPMNRITGALGPAQILRSIFSILPPAIQAEAFADKISNSNLESPNSEPVLRFPTADLTVAIDPRIPAERQSMFFEVSGVESSQEVVWILNGKELGDRLTKVEWPIEAGQFSLQAQVPALAWASEAVDFVVIP